MDGKSSRPLIVTLYRCRPGDRVVIDSRPHSILAVLRGGFRRVDAAPSDPQLDSGSVIVPSSREGEPLTLIARTHGGPPSSLGSRGAESELLEMSAGGVCANDSASLLQQTQSIQFLERHPPLASLSSLLRDELAASRAVHTPLVRALAESFLYYWERARGEQVPSARPSDRGMERAIELMRADPRRRWTVEALAKAVGLSRPAFARRFRLHGGLSPHRFLTEYRMELAAELLLQSDEGLAKVAAQVGYDSEFAFNRAFKRHHHVSPGVFRRQPRAMSGITMRAA